MRKHKRGTVTLLVTVALALGACGDGDEPRLTKAAFIEQGNAICAEISGRIEAAAQSAFPGEGGQPSPEEVGEFAVETVAPALEEEINRLSELRPPEQDVERIEAIIEEGRDSVDRLRQDSTILLSSADDGSARYRELAEAYGLENCGGASDATRDAIEGIVREG